MQVEGTDLQFADTTVINYINNIKTSYEYQIKILQLKHEQQNKELKNLKDYQLKYFEIKERYDLLIYKKFVRSAEKFIDETQQFLFTEPVEKTETVEEDKDIEETTEVKSYKRKKPGRKAIDPNIPRVEKIIDIPQEDKICACGCSLSKIGEESNEKLHIIPQRIFVERTIRLKYSCRSCEGTEDEDKPAVRIAPVEPSIIPRGIASASLLSHIMISKYEDHLPFYRQEKQFERIGVTISRQDMANWQQKVYEKLKPLYELMKQTLKSGPVLRMDETTVQVMGEEGRLYTDKSYMWLSRGGPPDKTVVWYEYRETRAAYNAKDMLEGYSGYLQTDGYGGYDAALIGMPGIVHVGCFAHARRKFFEASKATKKPQSAEEGMKYIRKLYNIENDMRCKFYDDKEKFIAERKKLVEPVLNDFKEWLIKRSLEVPPTMLLGKAISYSLAQWDKMTAYLESYHLTPDNNACENAIRPFVLGRKNWLFNQSPKGAESSCGMFTLIETAKQNGLVPLYYLSVLFEKAPLASSLEDWEKLLPWNIFTV
jgi:transposase